jgi:hypothetical protein
MPGQPRDHAIGARARPSAATRAVEVLGGADSQKPEPVLNEREREREREREGERERERERVRVCQAITGPSG